MWKILLFYVVCITLGIYSFDFTGDDNLEKIKGSCNASFETVRGGFKLKVNNISCWWDIATSNSTDPVSFFFNYLFLDEQDEVNVFRTMKDAILWENPLLNQSIKAQIGSVTVLTGLTNATVAFRGNNSDFIRNFEVFYSHDFTCPVPADVEIIHSPIYTVDAETVECIYEFNAIQHMRAKQVFTFLEFNVSDLEVNIEGATTSGNYNNNPPEDFFQNKNVLTITVKMPNNSSDHFVLQTRLVDTACSGVIEVGDHDETLRSPPEELNNGTIVSECRWLVKHRDQRKVLGLKFDTLDFHSVFDMVAVNDGLSEVSTPLLQVTTSNRNLSRSQEIRSGKSGPYLWISFKPVNYESRFVANVTFHAEGGYRKDNGSISMTSAGGNDTVFLLEVKEEEIVKLTFKESDFVPPATLLIYDGFDTNNLLTTLHGQIKFPLLSKSSRMMVVGTNFMSGRNKFTADFKGVVPGCDHMSTLSTENYILQRNCNSTCTWVISPQDTPNSELIIYLQYISLNKGDQLTIHMLDANLTQLGSISAGISHVPHMAVPISVGALVQVTQRACHPQMGIVLIGHSSVIPDCSHNLSPQTSAQLQISSPLYPDTYPLYTSCQWNISVPKTNLVHLAFQDLKLAENHCVRIFDNASKTRHEYDGKEMPEDLFLNGDVLIQFDSTGCKSEVHQTLNADVGFLLNVTVADCGGIMEGNKSGEFDTSGISGNKSFCIWKVNVYKSDSMNIISYSVIEKDPAKNYELSVYDGASVRDTKIVNNTNSGLWSRSSVLIFVYRRLNVSNPSSVLVFKYDTIACNSSILCDNKVCMHPDWMCNGHDDCGDFSDERNCAAVPIPPEPEEKFTGYSATAFWLCLFAMLLIGVIAGFTAPVCYKKYKESRYTRFRELSGIDG